jgi:polar amino acid transport system substrate-binding protein
MRMRLSRYFLATLALAPCAKSDEALRIASDDWCPFVCAVQGKITSGYLVDLTAQAMSLSGHQVEPVLMPLNRAIVQTAVRKIEGVYAPPFDEKLRLSAPIAYSRACFYSLQKDAWRYKDIASLQGKIVVVIDEYGYDDGPMDDYIAHNRTSITTRLDFSYGESAGVTNVQKLLNGRYPLALEHEAVMTRLLKQLHAELQVNNVGCLERALPLTIGFSKADGRSAQWIAQLAEGVQKLNTAGRLKDLQARYGIPADGTAPHAAQSSGMPKRSTNETPGMQSMVVN